jgi:hypothetical protein
MRLEELKPKMPLPTRKIVFDPRGLQEERADIWITGGILEVAGLPRRVYGAVTDILRYGHQTAGSQWRRFTAVADANGQLIDDSFTSGSEYPAVEESIAIYFTYRLCYLTGEEKGLIRKIIERIYREELKGKLYGYGM